VDREGIAVTADRPDWDEDFIELVAAIGRRATCDRGRSGCVIAQDKRILCTGYVGSPPGFPHCDDVGHLLGRVIEDDGTERLHCVRTMHAEQNALIQASKYGIPLSGATLYCTMEPCRTCAMMIVSAGISRVVCAGRYHAGGDTRSIFATAGIPLDVLSDEVVTYDRQGSAGTGSAGTGTASNGATAPRA
jgi:dCMP deaminase